MITKFKLYENFDEHVRVGDFLLASCTMSVVGKILGEPMEVIELTNFMKRKIVRKFTVRILTQVNSVGMMRIADIYHYDVIRKISKQDAENIVKQGYKFENGTIVKRHHHNKFFKIVNRKYAYNLKDEYELRDELNDRYYGWVAGDVIDNLTVEESDELQMIKSAEKYNI